MKSKTIVHQKENNISPCLNVLISFCEHFVARHNDS